MGRGRQKAKQTKVARELKYRSISTDFASLQEELRKNAGGDIPPAYADLADEFLEDDDVFDEDEEDVEDDDLEESDPDE